ncbi:MAG: tyrosine-type recombinase/integrase [Candidatus Sulfotelmatobacter sp.]|jgi:integrase
MSDRTKTKGKLPRGIHLLRNGVYRLYTTRNGRPYQPQVTWELLKDLGVPVPANCRLEHPGLELAKIALVKQQSKIVDEVRTGVIEASAKTKIGDPLLKLIEEDYLKAGKKTWDDTLSRWNLHLKGHFADVYASELSSDHINSYILRRLREKASGASINRELAVGRRMMHLGERTTPPLVRGVPHFPRVKESEPRTGFLEQVEYDKLRLHAHALWLRGLLATYYTFGFRRAELLKLLVRQVNLIDNTINLPSGGTKNGKPRTIVMTAEVRSLVTASIHGKTANDFVFTHDDGTPVVDFRAAWKKMFADAGVEMRKLHDMRRSAVRNAIRRGVDRDTVKVMSGHLTDDVFSRYNIQAVDDLQDAAEKIEQGAARIRATATKTATEREAPTESGRMLQ